MLQDETRGANRCVVGVDIGASSCKAILFDADGKTRGSAQQEHARDTPRPGWAELDANRWWDAVASTIRHAIEESDVPSEQIAAIGVSSETDGVVPVADDGNPLRAYIHWSDTRCYPQYDWILSHANIEEIYRITGISLHKSWWSPPGLKMLWMKENEPGLFAKTKKFLQIGNYVLFKLTGKYLTDYSIAARTMFFDIGRLEWSKTQETLLGIPLSTQPTLLGSSEVAGQVTRAAAEETGLTTDAEVVTGGGDTECSALGAGVVSEGQALVSVGTSMMALIAASHPPFLSHRPSRELLGTGMFSSCHVVDKTWLLEAGSLGGAMLSWFKREFGHLEDQAGRNLGISPYDVLTTEAAGSKPNPNSPLFVLENGALCNLSLEHNRKDIIRSILEGVAFEAQQVLKAAESSGIKIENITMVAGGSKSNVWRQILADVTNRPVRSLDLSETAAYGAGILAGMGTGLYKDPTHLRSRVRQYENTPDPETHGAYEVLYDKYEKLYTRLKV